jgi:hypothetical protein
MELTSHLCGVNNAVPNHLLDLAFLQADSGRSKVVNEGKISQWAQGEAEVPENANEALKPTVYRHDFSYPWIRRGKVLEMFNERMVW